MNGILHQFCFGRVDPDGQKGGFAVSNEIRDVSTAKLLYSVVSESRRKFNSRNCVKLFVYGSSMGGYGALLHGAKLGATAVYANVPQVKLLGSTYSNKGMKKYFDAVLEPKEGHGYWLFGGLSGFYNMNDLTEYLPTIEEKHPSNDDY